MGSLKALIIAVVAALTPLFALARDSQGAGNSAPPPQEVECQDKEKSKTVTVSVPNTTVNFLCQSKYTFDPPVTPEKQQVYSNTPCETMEPLTKYCPTATLEELKTTGKEVNKTGATLKVPQLPADKTAVFYVQCTPKGIAKTDNGETGEAQAPCVVKVTVNRAANQGQEGGVHVCKQGSITVKVPDKDSSVQFSCDEKFDLYPTDAARVFKDDCKTEEPLKNMTRTAPAAAAAPAPAGGSGPSEDAAAPPVYTLKAVKEPPRKKLCYLCATQEPTDTGAKPPKEYCAIYVESGARAKPFGLRFAPLALILSSVLAMLRLT